MPRSGPERHQVSARVSEDVRAAVRERARLEGVDKSEVVRRAIDAYLTMNHDELRRHLAEGLAAHLEHAIDQWKDKTSSPTGGRLAAQICNARDPGELRRILGIPPTEWKDKQ